MIGGELSRRAESLAAARVPFVTAIVVRVRRPSSVRPGDGALVLADGAIEGFVGGGCAVESVRLHALRSLETGECARWGRGHGVWKLLDRHAEEVVDVPVEGPIPRDADTWEDYRAVLAEARAPDERCSGHPDRWSCLPATT